MKGFKTLLTGVGVVVLGLLEQLDITAFILIPLFNSIRSRGKRGKPRITLITRIIEFIRGYHCPWFDTHQ